MSYLQYLCLFAYSGAQHVFCFCFVGGIPVLFTLFVFAEGALVLFTLFVFDGEFLSYFTLFML